MKQVSILLVSGLVLIVVYITTFYHSKKTSTIIISNKPILVKPDKPIPPAPPVIDPALVLNHPMHVGPPQLVKAEKLTPIAPLIIPKSVLEQPSNKGAELVKPEKLIPPPPPLPPMKRMSF